MNVTNTTTSVYTVPTTVTTEVIENETTDEVVETTENTDKFVVNSNGEKLYLSNPELLDESNFNILRGDLFTDEEVAIINEYSAKNSRRI